MSHEEREGLDFTDLPDVASTGLSALLRRDLALDSAIRDLVTRLKDRPEVTLAWNNYVVRRTDSPDPNSTT
jgi:hypothetical protein